MVLDVRLPLVPLMVMVAVPAVAELLAVSVRVEVAVPSADGVTVLDESDAVTPEGRPETLSDTAESKSSLLPTVIVLVPDEPCAMVRVLGESDNEFVRAVQSFAIGLLLGPQRGLRILVGLLGFPLRSNRFVKRRF